MFACRLADFAFVLRKLDRKQEAKTAAGHAASIFQRLSRGDTSSLVVYVANLRRKPNELPNYSWQRVVTDLLLAGGRCRRSVYFDSSTTSIALMHA